MSDTFRAQLIELVRRYGRDIGADHRRCTGLLADFCPPSRERVAVAAVARWHWPRLTATGGTIQLRLGQIANALNTQQGIQRQVAYSAAETWAVALGLLTPEEVSRQIACPNPACKHPGTADGTWIDKLVVCPRCRTEAVVTEDLVLAIVTISNRIASAPGRWTLAEDLDLGDWDHERLRSAIGAVLADDRLTPHEKAQILDLPRAVALLRETVADDGLAAPLGHDTIVRGVLQAAAGEAGLLIPTVVEPHTLARLANVCGLDPREPVLALVDGSLYSGRPAGAIFAAEAFYYHNAPATSDARSAQPCFPLSGRVPYVQFVQRNFRKLELQTIDLDAGERFDLSGSGMSTRAMLKLLLTLRTLFTVTNARQPLT